MEKKNNGGLIAIIIILLVALLVVCGYVAYDKGLIFNSKVETNVEENKETENNTDTEYVSLEIKDENCINRNDMDYNLTSSNGVFVSLNDDNTAVLQITRDAYLSLTNKEVDSIQTFTISNFSKRVIDVFDGTIGQDIYGETLIFLMEDGSLEYIPIRYALHAGTVQSYGKLDGVEGIVKLYSVFAAKKGALVGGGVTILAQKADGTYYDLAPILEATKNY